jgi:hypothetical protein
VTDRLILRAKHRDERIYSRPNGTFYRVRPQWDGKLLTTELNKWQVASMRGMSDAFEAVDDDWRLL